MEPLEARVRGIVNRRGEACAEVEVQTNDPASPVVLAYYSRGGAEPELKEVLLNDADTELDWFDNNMHQAFTDLTSIVSQESGSGNGPEKWKRFGDQVLAMARDDIRNRLSEGV
ncbi:hypothetical protein [Paenibacillus soyae]|uniref:Uncharacterized protein n=1 Tax=Paenibacillus soyae TaxID=2969249 RepID=A0A9X2S6T6_9BACL|nr:hypothetical protein [Paenibacillus soyae]MCR2802594.1 hypothetical protein [Paenibacillus soyae]